MNIQCERCSCNITIYDNFCSGCGHKLIEPLKDEALQDSLKKAVASIKKILKPIKGVSVEGSFIVASTPDVAKEVDKVLNKSKYSNFIDFWTKDNKGLTAVILGDPNMTI